MGNVLQVQRSKNAKVNAMTRAFCSAIAILLFCVAFATPAYPQISVQSGSWSSASTWNTPPVNNGKVVVNGGYTVTYGAGDSYAGNPTWWNGLAVGADNNFGGSNPGAGTLNITGGTLATGAWFTGYNYAGTINLSGGVLNAAGAQMYFGWITSSTLNVSGGTLNMTGTGNNYIFGQGAASAMNITGGVANLTGNINVQKGSQVNVNGGALNITKTTDQNITIYDGSQVNLISGTGTVNGDNGFFLGGGATTGTLNVSGGTWQQNGYVRLGVFGSGNGVINQSGGTFEMGSSFEVWAGPSSTNSFNLSGGTFRVTGTNVVFNVASGAARFNITGTSGNVTMDTQYDFTAPNGSTFNNAAATLAKTGTGKFTISSGGLEVRNGALSMQAGTLETASTISVGASGGTASGTMTGGTLRTGYLAASNFAVGNGGTGTFTQSGGTIDTGSSASVVIGWNAGSAGTYTLTGGTFSSSNNTTYIGLSGGTGTINVNGGSFSPNILLVGGNSAAAGTLNLNGGAFAVAGTFTVGAAGTVNVNSGGSLRGGASNNLNVQNGGLVKFNGGTGTSSMNMLASNGQVDVNGQSITANTWANLVASGTGSVLRNSSASTATIANGNTIWIWDGGVNLTVDTVGTLQIDSRITSSGQTTPTGVIKTGTGALVLSGNANDYTGSTAVNAGTLQITNGNALGSTAGSTTVASGAQLRLAASSNGSGFTVGNEALTISGQGVTTGGALRNATGTNTWQGKVTLAADATIGAAGSTSLTLDVASGNAIEATNLTLTLDGAGVTRVNDPISLGTGGLTKIGSGTTFLSGNNSYTGTTTVSLGSLIVNGDNSSATGAVTVAAGALLGGSGTIGGATTVNGTLSPGNSPGVLSVASLVLGGSSTALFEINGTTRGASYDGLDITGVTGPAYGGTLSLVFGNLSAFGNTDVFDLFSFTGSASGAFASVTSTGFYSGTWTNNNDGTFKLDQGSQTLTFSQATGDIAVVPEPGALVLAGLGIAAAAWARRRKK